MKKKRIRYCNKCHEPIFELVPTGESILGINFVKSVKIKPYICREHKYWCVECWEQLDKPILQQRQDI